MRGTNKTTHWMYKKTKIVYEPNLDGGYKNEIGLWKGRVTKWVSGLFLPSVYLTPAADTRNSKAALAPQRGG